MSAPQIAAPAGSIHLEARGSGLWVPRFDITRDGAPLTRLDAIHEPLRCGFTLDGRPWRIRLDAGRTGMQVLFNVLKGGLLGRGGYALLDANGGIHARARERGFFDAGYDIACGATEDFASRLDTDRALSAWRWRGKDGEGRITRAGQCFHAELPRSLAPEVLVFLMVLALRKWTRTVSTGGGE